MSERNLPRRVSDLIQGYADAIADMVRAVDDAQTFEDEEETS